MIDMSNKKKEDLKALLWIRDFGYKGGNGTTRAGNCYFYYDLKELMKQLLLGNSWYCLDNYAIKEFAKSVKDGKVLMADVGKNKIDRERYDILNKFSDISDGEYFVGRKVSYDSVKDDLYEMNPANRQGLPNYGNHCKLEKPRELTKEALDIINAELNQANSAFNLDSVFNLFAFLCCTKRIWQSYDEGKAHNIFDDWDNDKRERTYLGFDTLGMFNSKDVKTKVSVCKEVAEQAYKLTTALTGYELYIKDNPKLNFVDGIVSARIVKNDIAEIRKVGEPTIALKELLEMVAGDREPGDWAICVKMLFDTYIFNTTADNRNNFIHEFFDDKETQGITVLKLCKFNDDVVPSDFKGIKHCVVWCNQDDEKTACFYVYMWGETAITYEMLGDVKKFVDIVK